MKVVHLTEASHRRHRSGRRGHLVGDVIEVNVPHGIRRLKIIDVSTEHA
jgi:hypothetical protein